MRSELGDIFNAIFRKPAASWNALMYPARQTIRGINLKRNQQDFAGQIFPLAPLDRPSSVLQFSVGDDLEDGGSSTGEATFKDNSMLFKGRIDGERADKMIGLPRMSYCYPFFFRHRLFGNAIRVEARSDSRDLSVQFHSTIYNDVTITSGSFVSYIHQGFVLSYKKLGNFCASIKLFGCSLR